MSTLATAVKRQVNAIDLARTMNADDINEAVLRFPCDFCGAEPLQQCRSTKDPSRKAKLHSSREAILWAMGPESFCDPTEHRPVYYRARKGDLK